MIHRVLLEAKERKVDIKATDMVVFLREAFQVQKNITVSLYGKVKTAGELDDDVFGALDLEKAREVSLQCVKAYV